MLKEGISPALSALRGIPGKDVHKKGADNGSFFYSDAEGSGFQSGEEAKTIGQIRKIFPGWLWIIPKFYRRGENWAHMIDNGTKGLLKF